MAKIILAAILMTFTLTACLPKVVPKETIQKEYVPVYVVPKPPDTQRPVLETSTLTPEDKDNLNVMVKAQTVEIAQLIGYSTELEQIVNKYRQLSNTSTTINDVDVKKLPLFSIDKLKEFMSKEGNK
jgi:ABC-type uncharacterized transport system auxiliary subunit